jgi:hypothetical protein
LEEDQGLAEQETFDCITDSMWLSKYPNIPVLLSMCMQTIKCNEAELQSKPKVGLLPLAATKKLGGQRMTGMCQLYGKRATKSLPLLPSSLAAHKIDLCITDLCIESMGNIAWFLGCTYIWQCTNNNKLAISMTQTAKIKSMLDEFNMSNGNGTQSPYCSSMVTNCIPKDLQAPKE